MKNRPAWLEFLNPNNKIQLWDGTPEQKNVARTIGFVCLALAILALFSPVLGIFSFEGIMALFILTGASAVVLVVYLFVCTHKNEKEAAANKHKKKKKK